MDAHVCSVTYGYLHTVRTSSCYLLHIANFAELLRVVLSGDDCTCVLNFRVLGTVRRH